jgi:hypothetical protein
MPELFKLNSVLKPPFHKTLRCILNLINYNSFLFLIFAVPKCTINLDAGTIKSSIFSAALTAKGEAPYSADLYRAS